MDHVGLRRMASWPLLIVTACVLVLAGCQDSSGPGLPTSPEGKPGYDGAKPPPPPPADPAIAYVGGEKIRGQNYSSLKVMNADGSNQTTIYSTPGQLQIDPPSWSPDGASIVFPKLHDGLWLVDVSVVGGVPTGTNARRLLDRGFLPAWSPLGDQIAFTDWVLGTLTLEVISPDGGDPQVLYTSESDLRDPTWSPDATRIAFTEGQEIRVLDLGTMEVVTVLGSEWASQFSNGPLFLDWARTQDALTFSVGSDQGHDLGIFTMQLQAGTPTFVVEGKWPTWSPDDQKICFGGGDIIDLATLEITRLHAGGSWPDWRR